MKQLAPLTFLSTINLLHHSLKPWKTTRFFFFQTENTELKEDIGSMNYWKK